MRKFLLVASIALTTAGCGVLYKQPIYQGNLVGEDAVERLQVGQSKQQVSALLGTPSIDDPFHAQRWDYAASQRINRRGKTEIKNFTVYFEGDTVTRWDGEFFADQDQKLAKASGRQFGRNLAKDKRKRGGG